MEWIDVSLPMREDTVHWPGHPRYTVTHMNSMKSGDIMNVTAVSMCSHFGTHIDAPRHYVEKGTPVDALNIDVLIGRCKVAFYKGEKHIPATFINELDLAGVSRLIIRTTNSEFIRLPDFHEDYVALTIGAASALVEKKIKLLGIDGYSIGPYDPDEGMPVHKTFLSAGPDQVGIEELDLSGITPGDYELIALPIRLTGLEAAPTRVLLKKI